MSGSLETSLDERVLVCPFVLARDYFQKAGPVDPKIPSVLCQEGVTLTCTRGLTGVAEIQAGNPGFRAYSLG